MLICKLLGGSFLVAAGYGAGLYRLKQQSIRVDALCQMERLFGRISDEIHYRGLPLDEILALLRQDDSLPLLALNICTDLQHMILPDQLTPNQKDELRQALDTLGQRTGSESCQQLDYYQKRCADFIVQEKESLLAATKLYRQLGVCAGLMAALLMM